MNRKARLIIGSIVLALLMLAGAQVVLAWGDIDIYSLDGTGTDWDEYPSEYLVVADLMVVSNEGDYESYCGSERDSYFICEPPDELDSGHQVRACAANIDAGWYLSRVNDEYNLPGGGFVEPIYIDELDAYCSLPIPVGYGQMVVFVFEEEPTAWSLGVEGAFTTTQMQQFFSPDPVGEGGSDFIPNSGEWLTNITDYALSWLQTINQDDFLFFLMAFGLVNYIISWLWKQLSGASVMGEAQAWRGMFDDGEE